MQAALRRQLAAEHMYTCMHTYIHINTHAGSSQTPARSWTYVHMHAYIHTYKHTCRRPSDASLKPNMKPHVKCCKMPSETRRLQGMLICVHVFNMVRIHAHIHTYIEWRWNGALWFWSVIKTIMTDCKVCWYTCTHTYIHRMEMNWRTLVLKCNKNNYDWL